MRFLANFYCLRPQFLQDYRAETPLHAMALEYFLTCRTELCAVLLQALLNS